MITMYKENGIINKICINGVEIPHITFWKITPHQDVNDKTLVTLEIYDEVEIIQTGSLSQQEIDKLLKESECS